MILRPRKRAQPQTELQSNSSTPVHSPAQPILDLTPPYTLFQSNNNPKPLRTQSQKQSLLYFNPDVSFRSNKMSSLTAKIPRKPILVQSLEKEDTTPARTTLIDPLLEIPQTLPPVELPPPQQESLETFCPPEKFLYRKALPVLKNSKDPNVFIRHIPKQIEIDEFLKILKAKVINSYSLPLLATEIEQAYKVSPAFKNIYQYITTNMLPSNRQAQ